MKTKIEYPKNGMLTKSEMYWLLIIITLVFFNYSEAQTYLTDGQLVPVFSPTETSITNRRVYWDVAEINNSNNRLDIGAGVTQYEGTDNFVNGNWYKNENNSNFNNEVTGNRFIYLENNSNTITGYLFKLNDSTGRRDPVVTRGNGQIEIYINGGGTIGSTIQNFQVNGKILSIGQFSTDNYEDAVILSSSGDTAKIYKGLANGKLDTIPYRYSLRDPYNVYLAQLSSQLYPYSIINGTTSNKDELIYTGEDSVVILTNTNSNTFEPWLSFYIGNETSDLKIADINNDGFNDILVYEKLAGLKVYVNNSGTSFSLGYEHSDYTFAVSAGDFNKDGWNDIVINTEASVEIFLNTKSGDYFDDTPSFVYSNTDPIPVKLFYQGRSMVADLYNKGGLALIFSAFPDNVTFNWNIENVWRLNASDTDAVPAPAYLFKSYENDHGT
ncbi:MAG: VCBS repeat-containing protein, partial [Ignavibacteria bacterium]